MGIAEGQFLCKGVTRWFVGNFVSRMNNTLICVVECKVNVQGYQLTIVFEGLLIELGDKYVLKDLFNV